jgi:hypothetical protein
VGAQDSKSCSTGDVEQFLSMLRFENKRKLEDLPDLDLNI